MEVGDAIWLALIGVFGGLASAILGAFYATKFSGRRREDDEIWTRLRNVETKAELTEHAVLAMNSLSAKEDTEADRFRVTVENRLSSIESHIAGIEAVFKFVEPRLRTLSE
jgi:hypothetical protein